ncbi:MAG: A24 family peptidase [Rhizomicrobium sp.]|jgi:leader peptidase (prepilin peptidase)/N-methyltransferase
MQSFIANVVIIVGFAAAGGWLATKTTEVLAGRTLPLAAMVAVSGVLAFWVFHVVFGAVAILLSLCLAWALLALAVIDWLEFRLPELLTLPLIAAGLIGSAFLPGRDILDDVTLPPILFLAAESPFHVGSAAVQALMQVTAHSIAAAAAYLTLSLIAWSYHLLRGREGMGTGDPTLAAAAGAWLGLETLPSVLFLASVTGFVWALVAGLFGGREPLSQRIPFGVPLSLAIWTVWLYGESLSVNWVIPVALVALLAWLHPQETEQRSSADDGATDPPHN